jgi:molybdenum cofactor biosynthesis enzyme MoaA
MMEVLVPFCGPAARFRLGHQGSGRSCFFSRMTMKPSLDLDAQDLTRDPEQKWQSCQSP